MSHDVVYLLGEAAQANKMVVTYSSDQSLPPGCAVTTTSGTTYFPLTSPMRRPVMKPVPCPKCGNRAIRDRNGEDHVVELNDHDAVKDGRSCGEANATRARIRVCEYCANVWATLVREVET